ncbi:MAG TPA: Fur family transcriptional regulator [Virgibacillus sp.]|nr:Fur family transcriptional regulator [Virgibacillus sp.]
MNINEAMQRLKDNRHKITNQRKAILTYFSREDDGYRNAKALLAYLNTIDDGISVDTVYRNLYLYDELGILETTELDGEKYFRLNCSEHHHHHFICQVCGKTKEIPICPMDEIKHSLQDFQISDHKFEVYGYCPTCQNDA